MHVNSGYAQQGSALARRFERVFGDAEHIVSPSASCVAMVREHCPAVAGRVHELTEFLVDVLEVEDVGASFPHRVAYHPTCHSLRLLKVGDRPLQLLRAVRGLELVELPGADQCCGFGGTFAVKNAETSTAMLTDKMANVLSTHAEVCTAGDASCLMHIGGGLSRLRSGTRTVHLAEILASTEEAVTPQQSTAPAVSR
jgi:L-lactate dehydrogenase complex protein LldE